MRNYQITEWCHHFIKEHVRRGDCCIDATCGNGNDTKLLCELVGSDGQVFAFDIQEEAVSATRRRLDEAGLSGRVQVIQDSHVHMGEYAQDGSVSCIVFNFGYLPGGDHNIATEKESSVAAIREGLRLLRKGGMMSLCVYSGGDTGFEERDAILGELKSLDGKEYLVIVSDYYNRKNNPPLPVLVIKL